MNPQASESPGGQESKRGSFLEAVGNMAHGENRRVPLASAGHKEVSHEQERASSFPCDFISLGMVQAGCFPRVTNQLPKLLRASGTSTSQPTPPFFRID